MFDIHISNYKDATNLLPGFLVALQPLKKTPKPLISVCSKVRGSSHGS